MKPTMFAMVIALFALFAADGFAAESQMTRAELCEAKYGQQKGETNAQYEARIAEAKRTLEVAQGYIDSNMLWADNDDYFLNN